MITKEREVEIIEINKCFVKISRAFINLKRAKKNHRKKYWKNQAQKIADLMIGQGRYKRRLMKKIKR